MSAKVSTEKSNLAYIIEWLLDDALRAFNLIVRDTTSANDDIFLRDEVATALWARALFKLSTFTDYISTLAQQQNKKNKRDRERAIALFNLETDTIIPHCDLMNMPAISLLRKVRHELSHGAQDNGVAPFRRVIVKNGIAYVQCRRLEDNDSCDCKIFPCDRNTITVGAVCCKFAVTDARDAVIKEFEVWVKKYNIKLNSAVDRRRKQSAPPQNEKPNDTIPWWFEPCDQLWAFSL